MMIRFLRLMIPYRIRKWITNPVIQLLPWKVRNHLYRMKMAFLAVSYTHLITLSFLALPVIPEIRVTDLGVFDVTSFSFIK